MLSKHIEDAIKQFFDLKAIGAPSFNDIKDDSGKLIRSFRVDSLWIINVPHYYLRNIYLVGVYSLEAPPPNSSIDDWGSMAYKGMLLVDVSSDLPEGKFMGGDALKPVDLEWPGSMVNALASINSFPHHYDISLDGYNHEYSIWAFTQLSRSQFQYRGKPQTENMEKLWDAIFETIHILAHRHNIPEIHDFLKTQINYWP